MQIDLHTPSPLYYTYTMQHRTLYALIVAFDDNYDYSSEKYKNSNSVIVILICMCSVCVCAPSAYYTISLISPLLLTSSNLLYYI